MPKKLPETKQLVIQRFLADMRGLGCDAQVYRMYGAGYFVNLPGCTAGDVLAVDLKEREEGEDE